MSDLSNKPVTFRWLREAFKKKSFVGHKHTVDEMQIDKALGPLEVSPGYMKMKEGLLPKRRALKECEQSITFFEMSQSSSCEYLAATVIATGNRVREFTFAIQKNNDQVLFQVGDPGEVKINIPEPYYPGINKVNYVGAILQILGSGYSKEFRFCLAELSQTKDEVYFYYVDHNRDSVFSTELQVQRLTQEESAKLSGGIIGIYNHGEAAGSKGYELCYDNTGHLYKIKMGWNRIEFEDTGVQLTKAECEELRDSRKFKEGGQNSFSMITDTGWMIWCSSDRFYIKKATRVYNESYKTIGFKKRRFGGYVPCVKVKGMSNYWTEQTLNIETGELEYLQHKRFFVWGADWGTVSPEMTEDKYVGPWFFRGHGFGGRFGDAYEVREGSFITCVSDPDFKQVGFGYKGTYNSTYEGLACVPLVLIEGCGRVGCNLIGNKQYHTLSANLTGEFDIYQVGPIAD